MDEGTETTTTEAPEEAKGLRGKLEAALSENRDLKSEKLAGSFAEIGLNPAEGLGKAIAKEYNGEISTDALAAYAKDEYGYEGSKESVHPEAEAITGGTERLDEVGQTAGSVATPTDGDIVAKAEAERDYVTTMNAKGNEIAGWFSGKP